MIFTLLEVLAPVILCAGVGYGWVRAGWRFETQFASALVSNVGAPSLIITTISGLQIDLETYARITLATFLSLAGFAVVGFIFLRILSLSTRTYLGLLMFPNSGNMGLPVSLFAFGEVGLSYAVTIFCVNALVSVIRVFGSRGGVI